MDNKLRHSYVLKFHESEHSLEPNEISLDSGTEYVVPFVGSIIYRRESFDEESGKEATRDEIVGRFQGFVVHAARALNDGVDLWDHCDAHSEDLCNYVTAFYDEDGDFKESIAEAFEGGDHGLNLLIIDEIALHPDHRGRRIGLRTLHRLLQLLGDGCGFAATIPHPLQFQDDAVDALSQHAERNRKRAEQRLALYIDRLGFEKLPNTRMYVFSLSHSLPDVELVGRPAKVLPFALGAESSENETRTT